MLTLHRLYMVAQLVRLHLVGLCPTLQYTLVESLEEESWHLLGVTLLGMVIWAGALVVLVAVAVDLVGVLEALVDLGDMAALKGLGGQEADLGAGLEQEVVMTGEPEMLPPPDRL